MLSDQYTQHMTVFMVLNCGVLQALCFESCGFYVVYSYFLVTCYGLCLFSGAYIHNLSGFLSLPSD